MGAIYMVSAVVLGAVFLWLAVEVLRTESSQLAMRLFGQSADRGARCILHAAAAQGVNGGDFWGPSGVGEMRGEPCRVSPSAPALDASQRQRLWEACAALVSDT